MKLQHLMAIFLIIIIPIILILSMYIDGQLEVINLRNRYTTALTNATSDAMRAYESNTMSNDYSEIATSHRRDVNASINTFFRSLATNMGTSGYTISDLQPYIPAVLFTGYDGFYIYGKTKQTQRYTKAEETGNIEEGDIKEGAGEVVDYDLQPYVYYSAQYKSADDKINLTINYNLDDYVTVIGSNGTGYIQESGYLYTNAISYESNEELRENVICKIKVGSKDTGGVEDAYFKADKCRYSYIYDEDNKKFQKVYRADNGLSGNYEILQNNGKDPSGTILNKEGAFICFIITADGYFSQVNYFGDNNCLAQNYKSVQPSTMDVLKQITHNDLVINGTRLEDITEEDNPYYYLKGSNKIFDTRDNFENHKQNIIRLAIQENLKSALAKNGLGADITYKLPMFTENDWQKIFSNITMIAFMQDLPVKFGTYNSYAIATSTGNTEYVPEDGIYYVNNTSNPTYHRITCPDCPDNAIGYKAIDFERRTVSIEGKDPLYYYPQDAMACYKCIVGSEYESLRNSDGTLNINSTKESSFKKAITKERALQYKSTSFLRN